MEPTESLIEGIGDELLWTFLSLFVIFLLSVWYLFCTDSRRTENVHPEQEEVVERVREQLRDNQQQQEEEEEVNEDYDPDNAELPQCPVCLGPITYLAETNCGHRFCAQCILMYWRTDRLHILAVLVLLLLYLFIPFDLLPESAIGLIGLIDDGLVLLTVIIYVTLLYRSYVTNRAIN
uniref:Uncharacterized protein n=1 Tax=Amphimedon queenslandica TaxID=400682 RepID=A0A1X7TA87_AMPQE